MFLFSLYDINRIRALIVWMIQQWICINKTFLINTDNIEYIVTDIFTMW